MVLPKEHSVEVPDTKEKKATATRRSFLQPEELTDGGKESLYESFENAVRKHGGRPCLGYRPVVKKQAQEYVWQSYKEVKQRVVSAAAGLLSLGMEKGSCLGIFCKNCPEWIISDKACLMYGLISVPLYDTLGEEAVVFVIEQTEMPIIVAHSSQIELLVKHKKKLTNLQTVVLVDEVPKSGGGKDQHGGYKLLSFKDLEEEGAKVEKKKEPTPSKGDETCTIVYTSGTTGTPKGAVLTSDNFMAVQRSILKMASNGILFDVNEDDVHLSYLPLAHIFDRVISTVCLNVGARVGFYQGEPSKLSDDIATLRPTLLAGVPRVYSRIFDQILSASSHMGPVASCLFRTAVEAKKLALHQGYLHNWLFDRLIFRKVQAKFGGRIKCLLSGGAPLTPELLDFMRVVFACELHEVYGQTETTGGSCVTLTGDYEAGTVGSLLLCTEVKLEDIPDMNFSSRDKPHPRGEVCFRGPAMFKGYYKDEKNTKETIDEDGWVHTGDIGLFDERGRLKIIDRKKNLFKLAQGEYIAPDKIEDAYAESKYVKQVFVHGESDKSYLVAVVVAEEKHVTSLAEGGSFEEAAKDKKVKEAVIEDMKKAGQAKGLKSFEQVKDIHITKEPFTVDNGLLTPTMKVKRPQIKEKYQKELEGLGK